MTPTSSGETAENNGRPTSATAPINYPVDEPGQHQQTNRGNLHPVGQSDGGFNVIGLWAGSCAEKRAVFGHALVAEGSAELSIQRGSHRGLGDAGVGRRVGRGVLAHRIGNVASSFLIQYSNQNREYSGRDVVGGIVKPGRGPTGSWVGHSSNLLVQHPQYIGKSTAQLGGGVNRQPNLFGNDDRRISPPGQRVEQSVGLHRQIRMMGHPGAQRVDQHHPFQHPPMGRCGRMQAGTDQPAQ